MVSNESQTMKTGLLNLWCSPVPVTLPEQRRTFSQAPVLE